MTISKERIENAKRAWEEHGGWESTNEELLAAILAADDRWLYGPDIPTPSTPAPDVSKNTQEIDMVTNEPMYRPIGETKTDSLTRGEVQEYLDRDKEPELPGIDYVEDEDGGFYFLQPHCSDDDWIDIKRATPNQLRAVADHMEWKQQAAKAVVTREIYDAYIAGLTAEAERLGVAFAHTTVAEVLARAGLAAALAAQRKGSNDLVLCLCWHYRIGSSRNLYWLPVLPRMARDAVRQGF